MGYITPKEAAEKWGISQRRVHMLCLKGRIEGAERHHWIWLIPDVSPKPSDARIKSGRYVKPGAKARRPSAGSTILERPRLLERLCPPGSKLTYIHAGAGYGKTTLMMQYATSRGDAVWISLDYRDNDMLYFLRHLETSIRGTLGVFHFDSADHMPFAHERAFPVAVTSALIAALGKNTLSLFLDDVHTLENDIIIALLTALVSDCPDGISIIMASRHEPWNSLYRLKMDGGIAEITKSDLCFIREEAQSLWGFSNEAAYLSTEGWGLAIQSYHLASKTGKPLPERKQQMNRDLYGYLMHEIMAQLPAHMQAFLQATSHLPEMHSRLCDLWLNIANSRAILETLVQRNIFTQRVSSGTYRYNSLFQAFLKQNDQGQGLTTLRLAMEHFFKNSHFEEAVEYAILLQDEKAVQDCICSLLSRPFAIDRNRTLKKCLDFLQAKSATVTPQVMLAMGMVLSDQGEFFRAEKYLGAAIALLNASDRYLYLQAMTHMARVLRNRVSFEASNRCINSLLPLLDDVPGQVLYSVLIEKIYNLASTSHLKESLALTTAMMDRCMSAGDIGTKAWFERYLTVIYFYMGDYINCLRFYERSLSIPQKEQDWLIRHSVGAYAAKAYQMLGQEDKIAPILEAELALLKHMELYEEFSMHYLLHAEILHSAEHLKRHLGMSFDFTAADRYMDLASEYAVLNRSTQDNDLLVRMWHLSARLLDHPEKAEFSISEAMTLLKNASPFTQSISYGRMANAMDMLELDAKQCKAFFRRCIRIGEKFGCYAYTVNAYGRLAAIYLREGDVEAAKKYTRSFLKLSQLYGHYYYMRFRQLYAPVLQLAVESDILPDFAQEMLTFGGYVTERVYIHTLGTFYICAAENREIPIKIRTKKARELLAYLLEHPKGVTREQIHADLWGDSEADVNSLFHTRRGEIRQAFERLGAKNPILLENSLYSLNRAEIVCDHDLYMQAVTEFRRTKTQQSAQQVAQRYTGRYLNDLEALWAESSRMRYEESFWEAAETLWVSCRAAGRKVQAMELLERFGGQ